MKYIYLQNIHLPTTKAHGIYVLKSCEAAMQLGYDVVLFCGRAHQLKKTTLKTSLTHYGLTTPPTIIFNVFSGIFPSILITLLGRFAHPLATFLFYILSLPRLIRLKPDVVQTNDPEGILVLGLLKLVGFDLKLIYDIHNYPPSWLKLFASTIDAVIVDAPQYENISKRFKYPANQVHYIPMGYDPKLYKIIPDKQAHKLKLGLPVKRFIIGYIGMFETMGQEKGIYSLIKLLPSLSKKIPLTVYLVGGPQVLAKKYQKLAASLKIPQNTLIIKPRVPPDQVARHMAVCDVGWLVYPKTKRFYNGIAPMKAMEYAAVGLPIIASQFPSFERVFSSQEIAYVDPDKSLEIINTIQKLYEDNEYRRSLSARALTKVKPFTWINRQQQIFKQVASSKI